MPWKTAQKKAKQKRKIRLALMTLAFLLVLLLIGQAVRISHSLFSPMSSAQRSYIWDSSFNLNLVALTKPLSVISYNPEEGTIKIIEVADETYLDVPGGYGSWRAGSIDGLGGVGLLKSSFGNFLGLPIDGFIESEEGRGKSEELVRAFQGNSVSVIGNLKTDLTPIELARFLIGVRGVRFDKITAYNLKDLGLLTPSSLADGTDILVGDPGKIDALILKNFYENKIVKEGATIGVFNSTDLPGLAGKSAQLISHLGGNVIIQNSLEEKLDHNAVTGQSSYPYTTKRLREIFAPDCERQKNCAILGVSTSASPDSIGTGEFSRAHVNLILGSK